MAGILKGSQPRMSLLWGWFTWLLGTSPIQHLVLAGSLGAGDSYWLHNVPRVCSCGVGRIQDNGVHIWAENDWHYPKPSRKPLPHKYFESSTILHFDLSLHYNKDYSVLICERRAFICHSTCVEFRGKFMGVTCLLPPDGSWGIKLRSWGLAAIPLRPFCLRDGHLFKNVV